jgi:hypothetical protein
MWLFEDVVHIGRYRRERPAWRLCLSELIPLPSSSGKSKQVLRLRLDTHCRIDKSSFPLEFSNFGMKSSNLSELGSCFGSGARSLAKWPLKTGFAAVLQGY